MVLGEIIRNTYNRGRIPRVFWWRTSNGQEVDFIIERDGKIYPLEVKLSSTTRKEMVRGLFLFSKDFSDEIGRSLLINLSDRKISLGDKVESLPFSAFLREISG